MLFSILTGKIDPEFVMLIRDSSRSYSICPEIGIFWFWAAVMHPQVGQTQESSMIRVYSDKVDPDQTAPLCLPYLLRAVGLIT